MSEFVKELDSSSFEEIALGAKQPVMVDFWASWCGPCRMIAPVVEQLAEEYADQMAFCKVNVDDNGDLAQQYGIISIPTILFFHGGEVVDRVVGVRPKEELAEKIEEICS